MQQAYDVKELGKRLAAAGLIEGEDMAEQIYSIFKAWATESASLTPMPFDDLAVKFFGQLDGFVLPQIDKIDGQKG